MLRLVGFLPLKAKWACAAGLVLALSACGGGGGGGGGGGVTPTPVTPTVSVSAAASAGMLGNTVALTWSSTSAASCAASDGWSGALATSGTQASPVLSTTGSAKFTVTCTGDGGSKSASVAIDVSSPVKVLAGDATGNGWADGASAVAGFNGPMAVTQDASGTVYVADTENHTVRKISSTGTVSTLAGLHNSAGSTDDTGSAARFDRPKSIAVDNNQNVYVVDGSTPRLRKISSAGAVSTVVQPFTEVLAGQTVQPIAVSATPNGGAVFVLLQGQTGGMGVATLDAQGQIQKPYRYQSWSPAATVGAPVFSTFTASSKGEVWLAEHAVSPSTKLDVWSLRQIKVDGSTATYSDSTLPERTRFRGLAVDQNDAIYAAIDSIDFPTTLDGQPSMTTRNHRVIKFASPGAAYAPWAGQNEYAVGYTDGAGAAARFLTPVGLSVDSQGNLLVADSGNHLIRKVSSTGDVSTLAGKPSVSGFANGTGSAAIFHHPTGLALDTTGSLWVTDTLNAVVRAISPAGVVTTPAGKTPGVFGYAPGPGELSAFGFIRGSIAIPSAGDLLYLSEHIPGNFNLGRSIRYVKTKGVITTKTVAGNVMVGTFEQTPKDGLRTAATYSTLESGVAVSPAGDFVYSVDYDSTVKANILRVVNAAAFTVSTPYKTSGKVVLRSENTTFTGIVYSQNALYATASDNRIYKIDPTTGEGTVFAGQGAAGATDGAAGVATFNGLQGLTADADGNLYVADGSNGLIRKVATDGTVSTVLGVAGNVTSDWTHYPITLSSPKAVAVRGNTLYIITGNGVLQYTLP